MYQYAEERKDWKIVTGDERWILSKVFKKKGLLGHEDDGRERVCESVRTLGRRTELACTFDANHCTIPTNTS